MLNKKKYLTLILVAFLVFVPAFSTNAYASNISNDISIEPRWQHASTAKLTLDLINPIKVSIMIFGYTGTVFSNGILTLEKISGSNCGVVETWTGISSNTSVLQFNDTSDTPSVGTYRLTLTIIATRNGISEEIEVSKEATYPAS